MKGKITRGEKGREKKGREERRGGKKTKNQNQALVATVLCQLPHVTWPGWHCPVGPVSVTELGSGGLRCRCRGTFHRRKSSESITSWIDRFKLDKYIYFVYFQLSYTRVHAKSFQSCPTLCDAMDWSPLGSSVHIFSRQEYWSGLPCPLPGGLPDPGIEPMSQISYTGRQLLYH